MLHEETSWPRRARHLEMHAPSFCLAKPARCGTRCCARGLAKRRWVNAVLGRERGFNQVPSRAPRLCRPWPVDA
eukprot:7340432-Pyramimonas_sp.AAC.1